MSGWVAGKPLSSGLGSPTDPCFHSVWPAGPPSLLLPLLAAALPVLVPFICRDTMRRSSSCNGGNDECEMRKCGCKIDLQLRCF